MATLLQWGTEVQILKPLSYDQVLWPVNTLPATRWGLGVARWAGVTRYEGETRTVGREMQILRWSGLIPADALLKRTPGVSMGTGLTMSPVSNECAIAGGWMTARSSAG